MRVFLYTELKVGQYVTAQVEEVKNDGRVARLSVSSSTLAQAFAESEQGWNLTNLLPGLLVKATIKKVETAFFYGNAVCICCIGIAKVYLLLGICKLNDLI